jgi:hypothetical protein
MTHGPIDCYNRCSEDRMLNDSNYELGMEFAAGVSASIGLICLSLVVYQCAKNVRLYQSGEDIESVGVSRRDYLARRITVRDIGAYCCLAGLCFMPAAVVSTLFLVDKINLIQCRSVC